MGGPFKFGDIVQRTNLKNGNKPAYRFKGRVCGDHINPVTKAKGYTVSLLADPGCLQIFPDYMLEMVEPAPASLTMRCGKCRMLATEGIDGEVIGDFFLCRLCADETLNDPAITPISRPRNP